MKIIVEIDNEVYEVNEKDLNPKQIELLAHILDIPKIKKIKEAVVAR